jgi:hypothetical protein
MDDDLQSLFPRDGCTSSREEEWDMATDFSLDEVYIIPIEKLIYVKKNYYPIDVCQCATMAQV